MVGLRIDGDHVVHVVRAQPVDHHMHHLLVYREAAEEFLGILVGTAG